MPKYRYDWDALKKEGDFIIVNYSKEFHSKKKDYSTRTNLCQMAKARGFKVSLNKIEDTKEAKITRRSNY